MPEWLSAKHVVHTGLHSKFVFDKIFKTHIEIQIFVSRLNDLHLFLFSTMIWNGNEDVCKTLSYVHTYQILIGTKEMLKKRCDKSQLSIGRETNHISHILTFK